MNKKALLYGLAYAAFVILFKLYIILGGYATGKFGFYYSNIVSVILILPFYFLALRHIRKSDYNGIISGKECMRHALTVFAVAVVVISFYNYYEFVTYGQAMAEDYYRSDEFLKFMKTQKNLKVEDYPKIIEDQIVQSKSSAFKATTGKLFTYLIIGLSGAFIVSTFMKSNKVATV